MSLVSNGFKERSDWVGWHVATINRPSNERAEAGGPVRRLRWARILAWTRMGASIQAQEPWRTSPGASAIQSQEEDQGTTNAPFLFFLPWSFFPLPCSWACKLLVPRPGIELLPPAVDAHSANLWTAMEVPRKTPSWFGIIQYFVHGMDWHVHSLFWGDTAQFGRYRPE